MPRKLLLRSDRLPYHVTARSNNREVFPLPLEKMWEIVRSECLTTSLLYGVEFHAFVLMPNHFHIILTTPSEDLGKVMSGFMSHLTKTANYYSARTGHLFGGPYHWSLINSSRYFGHALKYVYRNPVRAGLCRLVEQYPYSTLHGLLGESHLAFPIHFTRVGMELNLPISDFSEFIGWLNRPFPAEAEKLLRKNLWKPVFGELLCRKTRRPMELLEQLV